MHPHGSQGGPSLIRRGVLRVLDRIEPWAAWGLLAGALCVFVGVVFDWLHTGNAKPATLLIAADLLVSGYGEVQDSAD